MSKRPWHEFTPADVATIALPHPDIEGPLTCEGRECPWPWEPQQLIGAPMGQYHCSYCGEMCMAGLPHPDWRGLDLEEWTGPSDEELLADWPFGQGTAG